MPSNYPVGMAAVESQTDMGIKTYRKWLLQMTAFLANQVKPSGPFTRNPRCLATLHKGGLHCTHWGFPIHKAQLWACRIHQN